jgi:hypothetical protein
MRALVYGGTQGILKLGMFRFILAFAAFTTAALLSTAATAQGLAAYQCRDPATGFTYPPLATCARGDISVLSPPEATGQEAEIEHTDWGFDTYKTKPNMTPREVDIAVEQCMNTPGTDLVASIASNPTMG